MVNLPRRDVLYPVRDTGRQSDGRPPRTPLDQVMLDIITGVNHHPRSPESITRDLMAAGYTRPTPVPTVNALAGLHPSSILADRDGAPWSAASISNDDFERYAPWLLVHEHQPPTVTTE